MASIVQVESGMMCVLRFLTVSEKATGATKRMVSFIGMERNHDLKRLSTQIGIDLRAAISRSWFKRMRKAGEALQNVTTCQAVYRNLEVNIFRSLQNENDLVDSFDT